MSKCNLQLKLSAGIFILLMVFGTRNAGAQTDSTAVEKLRTESGVDPTRINSRLGYSLQFLNQAGDRSQMVNKASLILGVNRWSFSIKPEIVTLHSGIPGSGFQTGFGDFRFSVLNAFYVKDKLAMAGSVEFVTPTGKLGFGTQYFTATPSLTFSYTFNPTLFLAVQPQYTFALAKDALYPDLNVATMRIFLAKFTKTGYFFVFEPRSIYDFENEQFDVVLSPIIGKALGGGFNLVGLMEFPARKTTRDLRGVLFQVGFNKNL